MTQSVNSCNRQVAIHAPKGQFMQSEIAIHCALEERDFYDELMLRRRHRRMVAL